MIERVSTGRFEYIECGVLEPKREKPIWERLAEISVGLRDVIRELEPDEVAVESTFFDKNARSALRLGEARGVALACAGEASLAVFEYPPATVKRQVAGQGQASKVQVQTMVRSLCALKRPPLLDASDALAIAICHAFRSKVRARLASGIVR